MATSVLPPLPVNVKTAPPVTISGQGQGIAASGAVYNVPILVANTETSFALPDATAAYEIKTRGNSVLKLSFAAGTSATDYVKVDAGASYAKDALNTVGVVLYFQTSAPDTVQIIVYA